MRKDFLSKEEYEELRKRHRIEKDGRTRDRKAVLLSHQDVQKDIRGTVWGRRN